MPLETLKNLERINEHKIVRLGKNSTTKWPNEYTDSTKTHINIDEEQNIISFKIQNGAIKENGHNGCQIDEIILTAHVMLTGLNQKFECKENNLALKGLADALHQLNKRKEDRKNRGVEGMNQA